MPCETASLMSTITGIVPARNATPPMPVWFAGTFVGARAGQAFAGRGLVDRLEAALRRVVAAADRRLAAPVPSVSPLTAVCTAVVFDVIVWRSLNG